MPTVERFKAAQESAHAGFEAALQELQSGAKRSHWIWYVFPQLSGLGGSSSSRLYGISGPDEAVEYLRDPLLSARLLAATNAALEQLRRNVPLDRLMGSHIDVLKLVSSMTLFQRVASRLYESDGLEQHRLLAEAAAAILAVAAASGHPSCAHTLDRLRQSP